MLNRCFALAATCCFLALSPGCGSKGTDAAAPTPVPAPPSGTTAINVHLASDGGSVAGLELDIQTLEIGNDGHWTRVPLAANLQKLQGSTPTLAARNVPWVPGGYDQVRMTFGTHSRVLDAHGQSLGPLKAAGVSNPRPEGQWFKANVQQGKTSDIVVLLETSALVQANPALPGHYLQGPCRIWMMEKTDTMTVTGKVTGPDGAGLPGVPVMAQGLLQRVLAGAGIPYRATRTREDGTYTLDFIASGVGLCVTTQPVIGSQIYEFTASQSLSHETSTVNLACKLAPALGTLKVTLPGGAAASHQTDRVDLLRAVNLPSGKVNVLARTAFVKATDPQTVAFESISPGTYYLKRTRYTVDDRGAVSREPYFTGEGFQVPATTVTQTAP